MGGTCSGHAEIRNTYTGKPEENRPLGTLRHTWEHIKMGLRQALHPHDQYAVITRHRRKK
jgi:hypothetical protein